MNTPQKIPVWLDRIRNFGSPADKIKVVLTRRCQDHATLTLSISPDKMGRAK
jgi:hypothetical protein